MSILPLFNKSRITYKHLQDDITYLKKTCMAIKLKAECIPIQAANQQKVMAVSQGMMQLQETGKH